MNTSRYPEAAFLAAMTASATHEVRNVLAIIKESAGLIEDLVLVFGKRGKLDQEKVHRAVDRIEVQVKRGADLLTNLNRLSHTLDEDLATIQLDQEVEQIVFLSQRFARKKGHRVDVGENPGGCTVRVNPLRLNMVLFSAMECCLEELPDGSAVTVTTRNEDAGAVVEFLGRTGEGVDAEAVEAAEFWRELTGLAESVGARAERGGPGYGIRIVFREGTQG